jgi:heme A synthase
VTASGSVAWRRAHLLTGGITLVGFAITGFHMLFTLPGLFEDGGSPVRFLYRANHLYLLFAGLLNLTLGAYLILCEGGWRRRLQHFGSACLLIAPLVLFPAFFIDPPRLSPKRPTTEAAIFLVFIGTLCHLPGRAPRPGSPRG